MRKRIWRARPRSFHEGVRDFWLFVTTGFALLAIVSSNSASDNATDAANDATKATTAQVEGRRIGQSAICTALSAVIETGRITIESGAVIEPREFERALEGLGLPPKNLREERAQRAAQAYVAGIGHRVENAVGIGGIVEKDGTLNCKRLRRVTKADERSVR